LQPSLASEVVVVEDLTHRFLHLPGDFPQRAAGCAFLRAHALPPVRARSTAPKSV